MKQAVKLAGIGRILMDGSLMKALYKNHGAQDANVGLTANFPATIIPINLSGMNNKIKCKRDAFLAAFDDHCKIKMTMLKSASVMGCCCADVPLFFQEVQASGWVRQYDAPWFVWLSS